VASYLIFFLLFLLQFVFIPIGASFFEGSKVYIFELIVFLLILLQLFSKKSFSFKHYNTGFLIVSGILLLVAGYHLVFHQSATIFFGNQFRLQGTLLLWLLLIFTFLSAQVNFDKKIHKIFIFGIIVVQFLCTIFFIGVGSDRPVGSLGEPNALAATMLFMWPFLFFPRPKQKKEWLFAVGGMILVASIIFLTGSRSGLIALGVQCLFLFSIYGFYGRILLPTLIAIMLLFASYITPFLSHDEYENRAEIWVSALHAGSSSPIVGVGFGNAEYSLHASNVKLHNHLPGYYVDSSHNIFLDWFVQTGIIGLGVLLFLVGKTLLIFIQEKHVRNITLLLGIITALSFNPASIVSLVALWWLIGQGCVQPREKK
jgi:O-antigen ligase